MGKRTDLKQNKEKRKVNIKRIVLSKSAFATTIGDQPDAEEKCGFFVGQLPDGRGLTDFQVQVSLHGKPRRLSFEMWRDGLREI